MILNKQELIKLIKEVKKKQIDEFAPLALAAGEAALGTTAAAGAGTAASSAAAPAVAGSAAGTLATQIPSAITSLLKDLLAKITADKIAEKNPKLASLIPAIKSAMNIK